MRVRKNARYLTATEKQNFVRAVLTLKNTPFPGAPMTQPISIYDYFVCLHLAVPSVVLATSPGTTRDFAHSGAGLFAWHREYLHLFEEALRATDPGANITIPYWDWSGTTVLDTIFTNDFVGPNGGATGGGGAVSSGYFAFDAPTTLPAWWPPGLAGWRVRRSLGLSPGTTHGGQLNIGSPGFSSLPGFGPLRRSFGATGASALPTAAQVRNALNLGNFNLVGAAPGFRERVESPIHSDGHMWFGFSGTSHMSNFFLSPNDPMFWLHHANIDRMWAMWQLDGHQGPTFYPVSGERFGQNRGENMWPWGYATTSFALSPGGNAWPSDIAIPNHSSDPARRPQDVVDHRALGYCYDTEVVLGIALDRSFSMTGVTPDPISGTAPNIPKWDAAKQAVVHMLQDCEAAYLAKEAYVVAGALTFTTNSAGNTFAAVFAGTPYGLIKSGAAPYSAAGFTAATAALAPEGNTPLAGALTATETQIVRAALPAATSDDTRYMAMLTDGKEYPPGPLGAMPMAAFPFTKIFALGFGIGGAWNGIDQPTVDALVNKGMPPVTGVPQSFFGGTLDALNKFFTRTVARAIGYTPTVDPRYELVSGQHVDTPFLANGFDSAFMITAVGYDFTDANWHFDLIGPDATVYHDSVDAPVSAVFHRGGGKVTIFLSRGNADGAAWIGRWYVRAAYVPGGHAQHGIMFMPDIWDMILPTGSPPVRGPQFTRFSLPPEKRQMVRTIPTLSAEDIERFKRHLATIGQEPGHGHGDEQPDETHVERTCAVSVDVFSKSSISAALEVARAPRYAGDDFEVVVKLEGLDWRNFDDLVATGRLVAPKFAIGSVYRDLDTIPQASREEKYLKKGEGGLTFDELGFLADYERARPGAFAVRDEPIELALEPDGTLRGRVSNNVYPGVHRVAVYVEGTFKVGDHVEPFLRVLGAEVSLGILPDTKRSRAVLHWLRQEKLVVSFIVMDRFENMPSPAEFPPPEVQINGIAVKGEHQNPFTGVHHVLVPIRCKDMEIARTGDRIARGCVCFDSAQGEIELTPEKSFDVSVVVGGRELRAVAPRLVRDPKDGKEHAPGTKEAMEVPLEERDLFGSDEEADSSGSAALHDHRRD